MIDLVRPWHYAFFVHGIIAATLVGGLCGLIGAYVVLRHMSYIGHGLSHAIFGGAVVSYLLQWNFYIGAGLYGFLAALLINATARKRQIGADAAIGVITTASFAFGVALISRVRHFTTNFEAALFGNILGVTTTDLWVIAGVSALTVIALFFSYKQMLFTTFDPEVAPTYGVPTQKMETLFALILASALIASMQVMGVTLIAAALVIPAVIGRLLTDRFSKLLLLTTTIGALCGLTGMYTSFYIDVASGATIVLTAAAVFAVVITITLVQQRRHGLKAGLGKQAVLVQSNDSHLF
ncbi:MAG: metal ABC transporter permease [Herpetosiphonaceae bacterium]|nr:metal ABC transporter permease [Herpetosiphonaceae bacterium]